MLLEKETRAKTSNAAADSEVRRDHPVSTHAERGEADSLSAWERISFSIVHGMAAGMLKVLGLGGLYRFARFFGTLEWLINHKRRRRFAQTLARIFERAPSSRERRRYTREYLCQSRCDRLFYLIFDCIPRERARSLLTIANVDLFDAAVQRGRGLYATLSHLGAQHVIGLLLPLHGYKVAGVRDAREGALRRYVQDRLDRLVPESGRAYVLFADSFPREIYRCLQAGYALGSALDVSRIRDPNQKYEEVRMFGEPRPIPIGPFRIALRCGSPVVQVFIVPEKGFRYRMDVVAMLIDPEDLSDESEAICKAAHAYAANVEAHARAHPYLMTRMLMAD